jgi:acetyltransferase-like isoleucine patch superfamily enzyme
MNMISRLACIFNRKADSSAAVSILANVTKSSVGQGCSIARRSRISRCQLGVMCNIGRRVKIKNSVLSGFNAISSRVSLKKVSLGLYSYIASDTSLVDISIGRFCSIGPGVKNHLGNHPSRVFVSTHPSFYSPDSPTGAFVDQVHFEGYGQNVEIGNDVWVGAESLLMDGITIGNGAIVAARSVVTKDVSPYSIVGGTPAKLIRYRFDEEEIELLEESQWWNRDLAWVKTNIGLFQDVKKFTKAMRDKSLQ